MKQKYLRFPSVNLFKTTFQTKRLKGSQVFIRPLQPRKNCGWKHVDSTLVPFLVLLPAGNQSAQQVPSSSSADLLCITAEMIQAHTMSPIILLPPFLACLLLFGSK